MARYPLVGAKCIVGQGLRRVRDARGATSRPPNQSRPHHTRALIATHTRTEPGRCGAFVDERRALTDDVAWGHRSARPSLRDGESGDIYMLNWEVP